MALLNEINVKGVPHPIVTDDGYYEEMTVGDAEQLISTQFVENNEPYLFRPTGGSSDVGNRAYLDKIVGGTVAWNQLVEHGNFDAVSGWSGGTVSGNVLTITGTSEGTMNFTLYRDMNIPSGHKTLAMCDVYCGSANTARIRFPFNSLSVVGVTANTWTSVMQIGISDTSMRVGVQMDGINGETYKYRNFVCFDLTQMFGSTIADYIYSLEQSQAGAGVAWFKKLFPKDYYEYNAGELLSVEGLESHDTVGFNQFDKNTMVVENVYIDNSDGVEKSNTGALSTDFIPVIPNTAYFINTEQTAGGWGAWYDADKNYISGITGYGNVDLTYKVKTAPNNAHYMRLTCKYNNNGNIDTFCINLSSPSRNGEYEPYEKHSYPLDSSLTLRGIPKLDASNNLYYDGDEYASDGKVKRKYGVVDLGTVDWEQGGDGNKKSWVPVSWKTNVKPVQSVGYKAKILCNKYRTDIAANVEKQVNDKTIAVNTSSWVYIYDSAYISVTPQEFKEAMSGVMLVYELATPTTETAEPFQNIQVVDDFGTEKFVSSGLIPAGHMTRYPANLRDKLQHLPSLASADGTYLIKQTGKQMSLVHIPAVFPDAPTEDGTYMLKATVSGGTPTYVWEDVNAESKGE